MIEVKNINGTSKDRYSYSKGYSSWLNYWKSKTNHCLPNKCACSGCFNEVKIGAHVMKTSNSNKWYIVPLCYECNKKTEPFKVNKNYLVEVNDEDTFNFL